MNYERIKRFFDIMFALLAIIIFSPSMIIIAILIKIKSPEGEILFRQKRIGINGKIFEVYKFRTMIPNAEEKLQELLKSDEKIREEYLKYRKLKQDHRIIPFIGAFLRKTGLDELPQFFNVLLGDMSIVGPRPYIVEEFNEVSQEDQKILTKVKPGITGFWQTLPYRHDTTFEERVEIDKHYIQSKDFFVDCKIILRTVGVMVGAKGL